MISDFLLSCLEGALVEHLGSVPLDMLSARRALWTLVHVFGYKIDQDGFSQVNTPWARGIQ